MPYRVRPVGGDPTRIAPPGKNSRCPSATRRTAADYKKPLQALQTVLSTTGPLLVAKLLVLNLRKE